MTTNILHTALALPDQELLTRIDGLVGTEREATVELVAHLAALELRRSLYAALGYGSLYAYCTQALRLSEDAACNRIDAARVCRRFAGVLDLLASGAISLSTIRLLKPHLTAENQEALFARATHRGKKEIEALIAEIAPRPDVPSSIRKLPSPNGDSSRSTGSDVGLFEAAGSPSPDIGAPADERPTSGPSTAGPTAALLTTVSPALVSTVPPRADRPIVQPLAPKRYRVQFTIGEEAHEDLERLQALLRREIPNGDAGAIFAQALRLLREKVEKEKLGRASRPRSRPVIRPGADNRGQDATPACSVSAASRPRRATRSRYIPNEVRREVWRRDADQCAFVSEDGLRCSERNFLELHHIHPFALDGPSTVGNIALRCRRHNQYEAELVFGSRVGTNGGRHIT
jgi:hypothetical protein